MKILNLIFIMIFFFTSLPNNTHCFVHHAGKISGKDESGKIGTLIVKKFRFLFGLKNFHGKSPLIDVSENYPPSPSPSPSPSSSTIEAQAQAPLFPFHSHSHSHSHSHPHHSLSSPMPIQQHDSDSGDVKKRVLFAILGSVGITFVICVGFFIWVWKKFRKNEKKFAIFKSKNGGRSRHLSSQRCATMADEQYPEIVESESDNVREISKSDGGVSSISDEDMNVETHSSDDESFHSFCGSHSSQIRFSDASAGSLAGSFSEKSESLSPNISKRFPPPPPPPPPPPQSSSFSTKIAYKAGCSVKLPAPVPATRVPPPPCPPPFLTGNVNSVKNPPPPPIKECEFTPLGKDGAPLPKLKPLHWDKVRAASDRSMVWDKLRTSSFELDEEMIESLFGYNLQTPIKYDESKSKSPSPSKHVLDPKRLQNITILSKALNLPAEKVFDALIQGDGLRLQQLEALSKMVLTKEEEGKLFRFNGDVNELGYAEKFVKALLEIPFAFLRIEALLYKETFEDEVVHLRRSFSMLEEACKELRSSKLFSKLLEAVLKTGNRMNVGTIRGGAKAFKLDALLKLSDVKGTDGKTTLLHFVVQEIIRSEGIRVSDSIMGRIGNKGKQKSFDEMGLDLVSSLSNELYNVKKTATIDLEILLNSVWGLSDGMKKVQTLVDNLACGDESGGKFVEKMRKFMKYGEGKMKEIEEDERMVMVKVKEIREYFHGEMVNRDETNNPLRIFVIVRDFLGMLDNVCKELRTFQNSSMSIPLIQFR